MDGITALKERVLAKQAEIEAARQHVSVLETEFRVWKEALSLVSGDPVPSNGTRPHAPTAAPTLTLSPPDADRRRGPRGAWRVVMPVAITQLTAEFGYADLERVGVEQGMPIKRHTLRSQLANYVNGGFVERLREGRFRFTEKGKDEFSSLSRDSGSSGMSEEERSDEDGAHSSDLHAGGSNPPDALNDHQLDRDE